MKKLFILTLLLNFALLHAQNMLPVPEQLQSLTKAALQNFPKMQTLDKMVQLSTLKTEMSSAGYLPILNLDASYVYLNPFSSVSIPTGPGVVKSMQMNPADNYSAMVNLVQPVIDFKTTANVERAKSDEAVSLATRENYRTQLAYQIAQIYYSIIFLNKSITVQQLQLHLVKSNLDLITTKLKNGDALTYDLVTMQVRFTNIENYITELQTQLRKQYTILQTLTGIQDGVINDSTFSSAYLDAAKESVLETAFTNNTDMILAQNKVILAEKDLTFAKKLYLPTLSVIAGAGYKNGFAPDIFSVQFNYNYGVAINVPLFPASRPYLQTDLAATGLEAAKSDLQFQKISVSRDVNNALDEVVKNEKKYMSMDTLLKQAKLAVELATERFREGVITSVELLSAETSYQDAQLSKLQTEYSLLLSKLELNRLSGKRWW
ncbi:MAG: TolC family protein [Ignavibacteria bacterium]|nr:TolC family protein [Ignavibacteria bacterium]